MHTADRFYIFVQNVTEHFHRLLLKNLTEKYYHLFDSKNFWKQNTCFGKYPVGLILSHNMALVFRNFFERDYSSSTLDRTQLLYIMSITYGYFGF